MRLGAASALLHCFIEDALPKLRKLGIRGAIELAELGESLVSGNKTVRQNARQTVNVIASVLQSSEDAAFNDAIRHDRRA